jgi:hypothetical protein
VTWEPSLLGDPATSFDVEVLPDHLVCSAPAGVNECTVGGLTNGREYQVVLTASNAGGLSAPVTQPGLVKPFSSPGAPQFVTAVPANGEVNVSWAAPLSDGGRPVTSYAVSTLPAGGSCELTTGPLSCTVTGLTNGTPYVFVVAATNEAGPGTMSAPIAAVTPRTVPSAVTSISATAGDRKLEVRWTPPESNGGMAISGYSVTAVPGDQSCTWVSGPLTCTLEGLTNGTEYNVTVEATNIAGVGVRARSTASFRPVAVPAAPAVLSVTPRNASAMVSFSGTPDMGGSSIRHYTVTASNGRSCVVTAGPRQCLVTGLTNGAETTFTVTATNGVGESLPSEPSAPTTPFTVPTSPLAVVATSKASKLEVRWAAPTGSGGSPITGYRVELTTNGRTWLSGGEVSSTLTTHSVSGLVVGRSYGVRVVALNAAGRSVASAPTLAKIVK